MNITDMIEVFIAEEVRNSIRGVLPRLDRVEAVLSNTARDANTRDNMIRDLIAKAGFHETFFANLEECARIGSLGQLLVDYPLPYDLVTKTAVQVVGMMHKDNQDNPKFDKVEMEMRLEKIVRDISIIDTRLSVIVCDIDNMTKTNVETMQSVTRLLATVAQQDAKISELAQTVRNVDQAGAAATQDASEFEMQVKHQDAMISEVADCLRSNTTEMCRLGARIDKLDNNRISSEYIVEELAKQNNKLSEKVAALMGQVDELKEYQASMEKTMGDTDERVIARVRKEMEEEVATQVEQLDLTEAISDRVEHYIDEEADLTEAVKETLMNKESMQEAVLKALKRIIAVY